MISKRAILSSVGVAIVVLVAASLWSSLGRPMRYELPPGFQGWVVVKYEDRACPPLPTVGMYLVVTVPPDGRVCTSSSKPEGWVYLNIGRLDASGVRTRLPLHPNGGPDELQAWLVTYIAESKWEEMFIGSKEYAAKHWGTPPDPGRTTSPVNGTGRPP